MNAPPSRLKPLRMSEGGSTTWKNFSRKE